MAPLYLLRQPLAGVNHQSHVQLLRLLSTATTKTNYKSFTDSDLTTTIAAVLPRLLAGGHHSAAVRLLSASLLLKPPPSSLPFPSLAADLAALPLSVSMAFLSSFHHHPLRPSPLPLLSPLLTHLFQNRRGKEAFTVFRWLLRHGHRPDQELSRTAVEGFCGLELMLQALIVVKEMALDGVAVSEQLRMRLYDGLLNDARIDEAVELKGVLKYVENGGGDKEFKSVVEVVDRFIGHWEE